MKKQKNYYHLLSKEDKERHFSHEIFGRKKPFRMFARKATQQYRDNYDKINWNKRDSEE